MYTLAVFICFIEVFQFAVLRRKRWGQHSCLSSTFYISEWNLLVLLCDNCGKFWKQSADKLTVSHVAWEMSHKLHSLFFQ